MARIEPLQSISNVVMPTMYNEMFGAKMGIFPYMVEGLPIAPLLRSTAVPAGIIPGISFSVKDGNAGTFYIVPHAPGVSKPVMRNQACNVFQKFN